MSFGFGKNSGPTAPPSGSTPFGYFPRPPSPTPTPSPSPFPVSDFPAAPRFLSPRYLSPFCLSMVKNFTF